MFTLNEAGTTSCEGRLVTGLPTGATGRALNQQLELDAQCSHSPRILRTTSRQFSAYVEYD